jgi:hypothetical protein
MEKNGAVYLKIKTKNHFFSGIGPAPPISAD